MDPLSAHDPPRVVHFGRYWRRDADMVFGMLSGLKEYSPHVREIDIDRRPEIVDTSERAPRPGSWGPSWIDWSAIRQEVEAFAPDVLVCNAGGLSFRREASEILRRRYGLLGIALSDPHIYEQCSARIARHFDLYLTNHEGSLRRYRQLTRRVDLLPPGADTRRFRRVPPSEEHRCEVLFLGRLHSNRHDYVSRLVASFDTRVYGEDWEGVGVKSHGLVFGDDLNRSLASARIVVVLLTTPSGEAIPKCSLFDFMAAGALVATDEIEEVKRYFSYGRQLIGFRSPSDMVDKIGWYLANPAAAERIRAAGELYVRRTFSWRSQWAKILALLRAAKSR